LFRNLFNVFARDAIDERFETQGTPLVPYFLPQTAAFYYTRRNTQNAYICAPSRQKLDRYSGDYVRASGGSRETSLIRNQFSLNRIVFLVPSANNISNIKFLMIRLYTIKALLLAQEEFSIRPVRTECGEASLRKKRWPNKINLNCKREERRNWIRNCLPPS